MVHIHSYWIALAEANWMGAGKALMSVVFSYIDLVPLRIRSEQLHKLLMREVEVVMRSQYHCIFYLYFLIPSTPLPFLSNWLLSFALVAFQPLVHFASRSNEADSIVTVVTSDTSSCDTMTLRSHGTRTATTESATILYDEVWPLFKIALVFPSFPDKEYLIYHSWRMNVVQT